ncbi:MAG: LytR/AlgR family response regulator transcription factor [Steroidobacteraceae bacterium]
MIDASLDGMRVLVVDDEAPARQRLTDLLRRHAQVRAVLEATDGLSGVTMIEREQPDLVFLDVQMPELNGLGVIDVIGPAQMPLTVFVTAYDQHAIRAFESNALDYLLKPFSDERFEATLSRAAARLNERQAGEFGQRVLRMVAAKPGTERFLDRLVLKSTAATHFVRVADIDWIEGAGVYVNLHVAGKSLLYRAALTQLAESLDPRQFVRVHRSAIVNLDSIVRLEPISHGEFHIVLKNGGRTRLSRTHRGALERLLGKAL